ncbi:efflux RND transporter periplasmic adaptor subunit [Roseibacillus ishigakijimensis]|uniref:Efflux RND transporter periplasmic adaptor subunit n=1 Tax=Roseibacillus ishigakijimensis TaxID=454146 RepID=A0A934VHG5_9BACT|nr:efflux RND transporter periplasmic adaptor subunit [Roseibacillus ishigakijimensis]MBK1833928.1 efflux RND transporter periplasmic adaptor subunit [Roseibacillus ishigakijimensis]
MSEELEAERSHEEMEAERQTALRAVLSFVAVLGILAALVAAVWILVKTKPQAVKKAEEAALARSVAVALVGQASGGAEIVAEGVVESQREVTLTAEVSGKLTEVNEKLVPGGRVRRDEILVAIEPADYRAALEQAKATRDKAKQALAEARLAIEQEEARREQALRDWEQLGGGEPSDLLVRKPQLESARARVASAEADIASAEAEIERAARNLDRTIIRAPFDAVVREESVEVGAVLAPGISIATLFSEESLEVELPLKLADYALLRRDADGQVEGEVTLTGTLGTRSVSWPARIVRTTGEVSRGALTAGVVAAVEPTDGEGELRLPPPGLFVEASLTGQALNEAVVIPREAVREGDRVAVVAADETLTFRQLQIVRTTPDTVLATSGVEAGERVVLTRLTGALEGTPVTVAAETPAEEGE